MLLKGLQLLIIFMTPFFLGLTTITLIISPAYPQYEYGRPNFPPDPYGLTQAERLDLALTAVSYLERPEPAHQIVHLLENQVLPGSSNPLYAQAELDHLIDVKNLTDAIRRLAWAAGVVLVLSLARLVYRPETRPLAYRVGMQGGLMTVMVLSGMIGVIVFGWPWFFTRFHELLFPPGTWMFAGYTGLIRLFPEQFWFDFGAILSTAVLLEGMAVAATFFIIGSLSAVNKTHLREF